MTEENPQIRFAERTHDQVFENIKLANEAAIKSGESAIKAVLLANGGAVVAVLSFLGNIAAKDRISVAPLAGAANSLIWFAAGVAAGLACMLTAYLTNLHNSNLGSSQILTYEHPFKKPGPRTWYYNFLFDVFHWVAILCGVVSLGLFLGGIMKVQDAIIQIATIVQK